MAKKDIFKIDNYLIRIGVLFLIIGVISLFSAPGLYTDLLITGDNQIYFEKWEGRTLEEVQAEKGEKMDIMVLDFPTKRIILTISGFFLLLIGIVYRKKENKIISVWDALDRTTEAKVADLSVSLGVSRDFILQNLKHINAQQNAYYVYVSSNDSIVDGRLMGEHVVSLKCSGCGNTINEKVSLTDLHSTSCPYCGAGIEVGELSKKRTEILHKNATETAETSDFSTGLFIFLLLFFWPAALIYYVVKKGNSSKKAIEKMAPFEKLAQANAANQK